jgi:hypothetical protein
MLSPSQGDTPRPKEELGFEVLFAVVKGHDLRRKAALLYETQPGIAGEQAKPVAVGFDVWTSPDASRSGGRR